MTTWILAVLGLWLAQAFFAAAFKTVLAPEPADAVADHLRGKDRAVQPSVLGGRAARAQANLSESLPVFLALALLFEMQEAPPPELATQGAIVFVVARVLYLPAYLAAVYGLRTLTWMGGLVGLGMMAYALVS